jgi:hypothetical protein
VLNRVGRRTGKGTRWTESRLASAQKNHGIAGPRALAAPNEAVGVDVDALRGLDLLASEPDVDGAARLGGAVAKDHGLADKRGVDLVGDRVEAHGAIAADLALLLEEEHLAKTQLAPRRGPGQAASNPVAPGLRAWMDTSSSSRVFAYPPAWQD